MTLQDIQQTIAQLSPKDFAALREWFAELDAERWDRQIETDTAAGRLDDLADRALQQFETGECRFSPYSRRVTVRPTDRQDRHFSPPQHTLPLPDTRLRAYPLGDLIRDRLTNDRP